MVSVSVVVSVSGSVVRDVGVATQLFQNSGSTVMVQFGDGQVPQTYPTDAGQVPSASAERDGQPTSHDGGNADDGSSTALHSQNQGAEESQHAPRLYVYEDYAGGSVVVSVHPLVNYAHSLAMEVGIKRPQDPAKHIQQQGSQAEALVAGMARLSGSVMAMSSGLAKQHDEINDMLSASCTDHGLISPPSIGDTELDVECDSAESGVNSKVDASQAGYYGLSILLSHTPSNVASLKTGATLRGANNKHGYLYEEISSTSWDVGADAHCMDPTGITITGSDGVNHIALSEYHVIDVESNFIDLVVLSIVQQAHTGNANLKKPYSFIRLNSLVEKNQTSPLSHEEVAVVGHIFRVIRTKQEVIDSKMFLVFD